MFQLKSNIISIKISIKSKLLCFQTSKLMFTFCNIFQILLEQAAKIVGSETTQKKLQSLMKTMTSRLEAEKFFSNCLKYEVVSGFLNEIKNKIKKYFDTDTIDLFVKFIKLCPELVVFAVLFYFNKDKCLKIYKYKFTILTSVICFVLLLGIFLGHVFGSLKAILALILVVIITFSYELFF